VIGTALVEALEVPTVDYDRRNHVGDHQLTTLHSAALVLAEHPGLALAWGRVLTERAAQSTDPKTVRVALELALDAMGVKGERDGIAAGLLTTLTLMGFTVARSGQ
jgi:hypothetical protein